jgi:cation-transporting ATPase E
MATKKKTTQNKAKAEEVTKKEEQASLDLKGMDFDDVAETSEPNFFALLKPLKIKKHKPFSSTVFTDRSHMQMSRYKKHCARIHKRRAIEGRGTVARFEPTAANGLTAEQVAIRVEDARTNYSKRGSTKTVWQILFKNIFTFFNILCFGVAGFLLYLRFAYSIPFSDVFFMVIILSNVSIGIYQELRAKFTIEKLALMTSPKARVVRDGEVSTISTDDIVLNDVLVLSNGQQIPADSVVLEGIIEVNESLLTGESVPIQKKQGDKVFAGSFVVSGTARVVTRKVGADNYVAVLARDASRYRRPRSELMNSLKLLIRCIGFVLIPLVVMLVGTMIYNADGTEEAMVTIMRRAAGAAIGMIPAGMFLLSSMALFVGAYNLSRSHAYVQELFCIEMLARADTLCLDKTGTITDGTMTVNDVVELSKPSSKLSIRDIVSSMLHALDDNNQTSIALVNHFGADCMINPASIMPFSSARKLSAVTFDGTEGTYVIGAPEFVLKRKDSVVDEKVSFFASQGYRVLLLAHTTGAIKDNNQLPTTAIVPVALITIKDNIRAEAPATIEWFKNNDVDVRVISGDNPVTVSEVAKRAGIVNADKYISLDGMNASEVRAVAGEYTVFGRVSPEQKLILVKELKTRGRTVAMTGDGVNDILALREADCSIAMAAGAEAARNVSHLVLLDSNFASMPKVVMEGRRVVNNVQKSSSLFLFKTMFVMMLVIFAILTGTEYLFNTSDMLLLEFFIIGIPSLALALEPNSQRIKGRFLFNVLKASFAGAFVIFFNVFILWFIGTVLNVFPNITYGEPVFKTMIIYSMLATGVLLLLKLAQPMNVYRFVMMASIVTALIITVILFSGLIGLELAFLNLEQILIVVILVQATYPVIAFINGALARIKLDNIVDKLLEDEEAKNNKRRRK